MPDTPDTSPAAASAPDVATEAWSGVHRGPLRAGEWVRLLDGKGRRHNICLEPGKTFHTNRGGMSHDDLIGREEGFTITSSSGGEYLVFRPLLSEFVVSMPRGAAVVYPKDAAQIVAFADIFPGAHVVEAGVGLRRADLLAAARRRARSAGCRRTSAARSSPTSPAATSSSSSARPEGETHPAWELTVGDLAEALPASGDRADRIILDMLAPWECLDAAADALWPGGIVCAYVATTTQLSRFVETVRLHGGFTEPQAWESLVRDWHVEGLAVRPGHKMIGHTAFLVTARRMAPGERAPMKKRRPAPGAYGPDYTGPRPAGAGRPAGVAAPARLVTNRRSRFLRLGPNRRSGTPTPTRVQNVTNSPKSVRLSLAAAGRVEAQEVALMSTSDGVSSAGGRNPDELAEQVRFLEAEVSDLRLRLSESPTGLARPRAPARRRAALAGRADLAERAPRPDPARGARPDHEAQGGGRPARPAAGRLRHLPEPQRGRLDRRLHRRSQAPGQRLARASTSTTSTVARR